MSKPEQSLAPFHLAIPVLDLQASRQFYGKLLGCSQGRHSDHWIDWNFFGHQLVTHKVEQMPAIGGHNSVDSKAVPVPHFGVVLSMTDWHALANRLRDNDVEFVIEPYIRFRGQTGEQATMFLLDPCGNALEFKAFANIDQLFAH